MREQLPMNKLEFVIDDTYIRDSMENTKGFYLTEDSSLLYQSSINGDYSILLGGNWRFELIVDSYTGRCVKVQCFLDELKVLHKSLVLPESKLKKVFIKSGEMLCPGEGCHYYPFEDNVYWDKRKHILCIGNLDTIGESVEFTPQITMVIKNRHLVCLYLSLKNIPNINFSNISSTKRTFCLHRGRLA